MSTNVSNQPEGIVSTVSLTKRYGSLTALDSLTLSIQPGEVFGLLGPNGSGKSTALRSLLGFLRPTSGFATVAGHDCWYDGVEARKQIAYLPAELRLYERMNGRQIIKFLAELRGQEVREQVDRLAAKFEIDLNRPLVQLSSGMKRKVALLAVLAPRTPVVILDEPTNALDPTVREELLAQILLAKERGQTVLFSSHILAEVEVVCDRVGILKAGKLVHLQSLEGIRKGRKITVKFSRKPDAWPVIEGIEHPPGLPGFEAELHTETALNPLLAWISQQSVTDLRVEPYGLAPVYARYHGSEVSQ